MAPSWVISKTRNVVAKLVPDRANKRYDIEVHSGVSAEEMTKAAQGTVRDGRLVHLMNPERSGVEIKTIRGDYRSADSNTRNRLRLWKKSDFVPNADDIFQERLYCIQWITRDTLDRNRQKTFFAAVTEDDLARERRVETIVRVNLSRWQDEGLVPDLPIERGDETTRLFRERGWTHWNHLFAPRQLLVGALLNKNVHENAEISPTFAKVLDYGSKLCRWDGGHPGSSPQVMGTFTNQALNPLVNYGAKAYSHLAQWLSG